MSDTFDEHMEDLLDGYRRNMDTVPELMRNFVMKWGAASNKSAEEIKELADSAEQAADATINMAGNMKEFTKDLAMGSVGIAKMGKVVADTVDGIGDLMLAIPGIGIAGKVFMKGAATAAAKAFEFMGQVYDPMLSNFSKLSKVGGAAADGFDDFVKTARDTQMSQEQWIRFITDNSEKLAFLGGTVDESIKDIQAATSSLQREALNPFRALGYEIDEVAEKFSDYANLQRSLGNYQKLTAQQLTTGTLAYVKELRVLSALTGKSAEEMEKQRADELLDPRFLAGMANYEEPTQEQMQIVASTMQDGFMKDVFKGVITTGIVEDNDQQFMSTEGGSAFVAEWRQRVQEGTFMADEFMKAAQEFNRFVTRKGGILQTAAAYGGRDQMIDYAQARRDKYIGADRADLNPEAARAAQQALLDGYMDVTNEIHGVHRGLNGITRQTEQITADLQGFLGRNNEISEKALEWINKGLAGLKTVTEELYNFAHDPENSKIKNAYDEIVSAASRLMHDAASVFDRAALAFSDAVVNFIEWMGGTVHLTDNQRLAKMDREIESLTYERDNATGSDRAEYDAELNEIKAEREKFVDKISGKDATEEAAREVASATQQVVQSNKTIEGLKGELVRIQGMQEANPNTDFSLAIKSVNDMIAAEESRLAAATEEQKVANSALTNASAKLAGYQAYQEEMKRQALGIAGPEFADQATVNSRSPVVVAEPPEIPLADKKLQDAVDKLGDEASQSNKKASPSASDVKASNEDKQAMRDIVSASDRTASASERSAREIADLRSVMDKVASKLDDLNHTMLNA